MSQQNQVRVLAVEDDPSWQFNYEDILGSMGYTFEIAASYEEAVVKAEAEVFHVAIIDLRLVDQQPDNEDGVLVLESLTERNPHMLFIVCTGYGTEQQIEELRARFTIVGWIDKRDFRFHKLATLLQEATRHMLQT